MCDTAVVVTPSGVLFAKSSDRDPNEAQHLEWRPRALHAPGDRVRCTWISIPEARETHAILISKPFWMWGAEIGTNEHGVTIGNEAVFTRERVPETGLTGMDLLRLALERAASAKEAVETILELIEAHGQGGRCGHEVAGFRYFSSFIVADRRGAFVLETSRRKCEVRAVEGARSISNGLTLMDDRRDPIRTFVAEAAGRRTRTERAVSCARNVGDLMTMLRDHGHERGPRYRFANGAMSAPCMHAGGVLAAGQTVASWVAKLGPQEVSHWVTATAAPCTSIFKPVGVAEPLDVGPLPTDRDDGRSLFWRHERLHRAAMRDPERLLPLFAGERDSLEKQ
ncbi:MAG: carcinine hydrolase/isopenicillin-N N-acyltransferase family protein, partial [Polyangiales bacterium]